MPDATPTIAVTAATEPLFTLAEGPLWDAVRRRLLWVDIPTGLVLVGRLDGKQVDVETRHEFEGYVGAAALAEDGSILVAETRRLTRISPDGARTSTSPVPELRPHERFNDGICDAAGRFLVGTASLTEARHSQRLLRFSPAGVAVLDDDLGLSNGLDFSPDGGTLYSVDSVPGRVWRRDYDHDTGATGTRDLLLDLPDSTPDGLAVDSAGNLWLAIWGRGEVRCFSPAGDLLDTLRVPAPHTTSVAFAGDGLDRLVITTARDELTAPQLAQFPLSGSLFVATPGCTGLPTHLWSGQLSP